MTVLRAGSATHVGQIRSVNQDTPLLVTERNLFGVADGMGGHQGGEVASAMAVELAARHATERSLDSLMDAARKANRAIFEKAGSDRELHGMGTTLVALQVVDGAEGDEIAWINVGDSRIYLMRDDDLRQLSHDHSLVEDLVRDGRLSREDAASHPQRNILTRALGIDVDVKVDGSTLMPLLGDRYLLCSDGLFNEVPLDQIASVLRRLENPDDAASELVRLANENGGRDNITVVVVDVIDDGGRSASITAAQQAAAAAASVAAAAAAEIQADDEAGSGSVRSDPEVFAGRESSLPQAEDDYGAENDDVYNGMDKVRSRRLTFGVVAFVVALLAIAAVVVGAIIVSNTATYHVAFDDDQVVLYQGKPGNGRNGEPQQIFRDQLPEALRAEVDANKEFGSRGDADSYLLRLYNRQVPATTTTVATTTTTSPVTTTTAPAPTTTGPDAPGPTQPSP